MSIEFYLKQRIEKTTPIRTLGKSSSSSVCRGEDVGVAAGSVEAALLNPNESGIYTLSLFLCFSRTGSAWFGISGIKHNQRRRTVGIDRRCAAHRHGATPGRD